MNPRIVFIYDGECPFCNHFAELLELKSNISNIEIKDARSNYDLLPKGYDMDTNGAILLNGDDLLKGSKAINWICSNIEDPSDSLLKLLVFVFSSSQRTNLLFPFLLIARRLLLFIRGVPRKITP